MIAIHGKGYPTEFGVRYLDCVIITLYGEQLLQKQASVAKLYENACIINLNIFHWRFLIDFYLGVPILVRGTRIVQFRIYTIWECLHGYFTNCTNVIIEKKIFFTCPLLLFFYAELWTSLRTPKSVMDWTIQDDICIVISKIAAVYFYF